MSLTATPPLWLVSPGTTLNRSQNLRPVNCSPNRPIVELSTHSPSSTPRCRRVGNAVLDDQ